MERAMKNEVGSMSENKTRNLVMTALLAALACVATYVVKIPTPTNGYLNLGDTVVLLSAYLLGPGYGALAGGIGSALSDLLAGYLVYAPATLGIKALMAVVAASLYRKLKKTMGGTALCGIAAEIPMVVGYWLYEGWIMKNLWGAAVGIPSNLVQAGLGAAASTLLVVALRRSAYVRRRFPTL